MIIIGGLLRKPFFVPPDEFLRELRNRRYAISKASSYLTMEMDMEDSRLRLSP